MNWLRDAATAISRPWELGYSIGEQYAERYPPGWGETSSVVGGGGNNSGGNGAVALLAGAAVAWMVLS